MPEFAFHGAQKAAERRSRLRLHLQCLADEFQNQLDLENSMVDDNPEGTVVVHVKMSATLAKELIESLHRAKALI